MASHLLNHVMVWYGEGEVWWRRSSNTDQDGCRK